MKRIQFYSKVSKEKYLNYEIHNIHQTYLKQCNAQSSLCFDEDSCFKYLSILRCWYCWKKIETNKIFIVNVPIPFYCSETCQEIDESIMRKDV